MFQNRIIGQHMQRRYLGQTWGGGKTSQETNKTWSTNNGGIRKRGGAGRMCFQQIKTSMCKLTKINQKQCLGKEDRMIET